MISYSRRDFIQTAAAATIAISNPTADLALLVSERRVFSPGIQLYMVNDELIKDPAGTLSALAGMGYAHVEISPLSSLQPSRLKGFIDAAGLECHSGHFLFGIYDTDKLLSDAHAFGVKYVVSTFLPWSPLPMHPGLNVLPFNHYTAEDFKRVAAKANEIGEKARQAGFKYAYHNHSFEFHKLANGQTGYEILLAETDLGLVSFEADCGWMYAGGVNTLEYLKSYPTRYVLLHLKDIEMISRTYVTIGEDDVPPITEIGHGSVGCKQILEVARKIAIEYCIVDHDPPFKKRSALDAARIDCDFVRKFG